MSSNKAKDMLAEKMLQGEDASALLMAQRLAAADPDVRLALSHAWWTGLRQGIEAVHEGPLRLPADPFRRAALEGIGERLLERNLVPDESRNLP